MARAFAWGIASAAHLRLGTMVVDDRLDFVRRKILQGFAVRFGFSHTGMTDKNQITILVGIEPEIVPALSRGAMLHSLAAATAIVQAGCAVDRGHRHSDGTSNIGIWVSMPACVSSAQVDAASSGGSPDEAVVTSGTSVVPGPVVFHIPVVTPFASIELMVSATPVAPLAAMVSDNATSAPTAASYHLPDMCHVEATVTCCQAASNEVEPHVADDATWHSPLDHILALAWPLRLSRRQQQQVLLRRSFPASAVAINGDHRRAHQKAGVHAMSALSTFRASTICDVVRNIALDSKGAVTLEERGGDVLVVSLDQSRVESMVIGDPGQMILDYG